MDRRVTTPRWVTSPTWSPPPPCKQALSVVTPKPNQSQRPTRRKENTFKSQWQLKVKPTKLTKARENAGDQVVNGF